MFITVAVQLIAMETDEFSIYQCAVSHSSPVSFSIAYPKGWKVTQDSSIHVGAYLVSDGIFICTFWTTNSSATNYAGFTIFRSRGATEEEAAQEFSKEGLKPVKTSGGDSGYLLEFDEIYDNKKFPRLQEIPGLAVTLGDPQPLKLGQVIRQEFFFHGGNKGSIRVEIETREVDSLFRSELDKMVLETLKFDGA